MRYLNLSSYLKQRFGQKVWKIPLDAGFGCPNRDGTLSKGGCVFCNPLGSGTGNKALGLTLAQQWEEARLRLARKHKAKLFIAYLQSYSNTHGPCQRLIEVLKQLSGLPGLGVLSVGTRPDCLDARKLEALAAFPASEVWLELGLQSSNDQTLRLINRGHDAACFAQACRSAAGLGLKVCAHLVAGLPGEGEGEFLESVDFISGLPVWGVKFHNLYVARQTPLATWLAEGRYLPLGREAYISWIVKALARLRPDMVVHRLNADPVPGELLEPKWALDKNAIIRDIVENLESNDSRQGRLWQTASGG